MENQKESENKKSEAALREEKVLEFWLEQNIFEKSLAQTEGGKEFIFYEGPPTANAKPALHHLEARAFKDAIPRYKTMRGFHVRRKAGWDTHGLPVELQVEKKLGLNSKKAIEEYGVAKFNRECKESVWEYLESWNKFTERIGFWVDQKNPYVTYENDYIESVWNVLKTASDKSLLYKDYKVVPWCPRCGTALSSHELAQGYEEVKDLSIYAKFKIVGFPDAYLLAWTTTPWTLPGNIALAVGEDVTYVEAKVTKDNKSEILVLAKERLSILTDPYEIIAEHKGKEMVGMQYEPLFPFLKNLAPSTSNLEPAYKVYAADFVNTEEGTGIVHTAVMYGQDDFELGTKVGLPKYHLVNPEGKFIKGTGFLEGRFVREINADGKPTLAVDIIEDLKKRNLFFKQENYKHSYPHCWRCKTALIYYARNSWYIKMSDPKVKKQLIKENKNINWEPAYTRDGRFGEWLREIKDWAISRERYWGTPLPVWVCEKCNKKTIAGGLDSLKSKIIKSGNKYFVMRHGESENNVKNIHSSDPNVNSLTREGREQTQHAAKELGKHKITIIFSSPFLRAKETAEIIAEYLGLDKSKIVYDDRISELHFGDLSDKPARVLWDFMNANNWDFSAKLPNGESYQDAKNRFGNFLYEIDQKNKRENILIVTHGIGQEVIPAIMEAADKKRSMAIWEVQTHNRTGSIRAYLDFASLPHNENYELDLHRPYIDEVKLTCDCGGVMNRTKEVMDVWLDSGCMPFAQDHYPFENKKWVEGKGYPADYISEAIDQTRGWFYTLHAVGVLMGRGKAFKNVICLGHLLDANGKKMSKSLGNIVDPWEVMDKYGVDTLRLWMYSVNQPGESKNFDEKTVALLAQQTFGLLYNVLAFYELYRDKNLEINNKPKSKNILDAWILTRLDELVKLSTENLDNYKLLEPTRATKDFIGDLSTWYLRRSRERIKEGDKDAKQTLYFVLKTLAKVLAPFAPFAAEDIWLKLKNKNDVESVHLAKWPGAGKVDNKIIQNMEEVRKIVSEALMARQFAKIRVRQPLAKLKIQNISLKNKPEFFELIKDEVNVETIIFDEKMVKGFELDTTITEELETKGNYRELMRTIQDLRKKMGLTPKDKINLILSKKYSELVKKFEEDLKKVALASSVSTENLTEDIKIDKI